MHKKRGLLKIADEIEKCPECKTWGTGKAVPGEGNPDADIVFIGEAPGTEEAKTGRPFVGRSGRLLREFIREIGLAEDDVFITSPVKYLPLRGTPSRENILHGREHLARQFAIIDPKIVVLLGNTACVALLDRKVPITKEHGSTLQKDGRKYFITFHPAYALRFPEGKKALRRDFGILKKLINE
jgi:DNA polymerase